MLNSGEMTMRRLSAPLKGEPPRFQLQESDTSQLQSSWPRACAANRVTEVMYKISTLFSASISVNKITREEELVADIRYKLVVV